MGLTPVLQKNAINSTDPLSPIYVPFMETLVMVLALSPILGVYLIKHIKIIRRNLVFLLTMGFFGSLASWAIITAFSQNYLAYSAAVTRLSTIFTIILGGLLFKEQRLKERLLGGSIMVLGTILLVI